ADLLNTRFSPDSSLAIYKSVQSALEPEIDRHLQRWGGKKTQWTKNCEVVKNFLQLRRNYLLNHVLQEFNLSGAAELQLRIEPPQSGSISLNSLTINAPSWKGLYFRDVPISLRAFSLPGYRFSSWNGVEESSSVFIRLNGDSVLTAFFVKDEASPYLIINEINYNSPPYLNAEDWIELYNPQDRTIDISFWKLTDFSNNSMFSFPQGCCIGPFQYLVVCKNQAAFQTIWGKDLVFLGDLPFGLSSKGDFIALLDDKGNVIDSLRFGVVWPWPAAANGKGAALALRYPWLDNSKAENWFASYNGGTPGFANTIRGEVDAEKQECQALSLSVYPNPMNSYAMIFVKGKTTQKCFITITDLLGRKIKDLYEGEIDETLLLNWNPSFLPSGIYFVILSTKEEKRIQKILIIR
ncbi:MAG: lamin tail domain-containing protein, partial [candidate division KSB1 bacterium]|nr:lamin tail domain-containing protein [candidate division KSB1 bacterium]